MGALHFITGEFSVVHDVLVFGIASAAGFRAPRKFSRKVGDAHDADSDVNQY